MTRVISVPGATLCRAFSLLKHGAPGRIRTCDTRFRKPMLYPLSYEGLRCTFAQHGGWVLVRRARVGCLAPDGLCRTCAACRGPASHYRPHTRRRLYGGWCRAQSWRPRERLGNDVVAVGCGDARPGPMGRLNWTAVVAVEGLALVLQESRCAPIRAQEVPHRSSADDVLLGQRIPTAHAAGPFLNRVSQVRILPGAPLLTRRN
jgi:hypothetical protein